MNMIEEWEEYSLVNSRAEEVIDSLNSRPEVRLVIKYCFDAGGKRTRPLILLLSNELAGGDTGEALDAAVAVEFIHNASLLHDDILDKGLFRRGKETPYQRFGYKPALLAGDLMITLAMDLMVSGYGSGFVGRVNEVVRDIINGEVMDVTCDEDTTLDDYEECIDMKTARLFGMAASMGGELAGSGDTGALEAFGRRGGMAYQVVDDLLEFLQVQRDKTALESSLTLPEIYMRDRGMGKKEATRASLGRINRLVDESLSELETFGDNEIRYRLEDLMRHMTFGVLERSRCAVKGTSLSELMAEA